MSDARIVDVDFRTTPVTTQLIAPYLSAAYRDLLRLDGVPRGKLTTSWSLPSTIYREPHAGAPSGAYRDAVYTVGSDDPVEQSERYAEELAGAAAALDRNGIARAVLSTGAAPDLSGIGNPYLSTEIVRATNDWLLEQWLPADDRFLASIVVSGIDPHAAGAEIRRVGSDARIVQVAIAFPPAPLGNRILHPIFAAAEELDLTVSLEAGGAFTGSNRGIAGPGIPATLFEHEIGWNAAAQPHVLSLVAEGVFEKFPRLRLLLNGFGAAWLPSLLWRMDAEHAAGRLPKSTTRPPSEYVRDHVHLTTGGLELPAEPEQLETLLALVGADRLLVFGSGAGRRELEGTAPLSALPESLRRLVLVENADGLYTLAFTRA
jgi:predicted TIM-barrel fold metal-dependent hydrolase